MRRRLELNRDGLWGSFIDIPCFDASAPNSRGLVDFDQTETCMGAVRERRAATRRASRWGRVGFDVFFCKQAQYGPVVALEY